MINLLPPDGRTSLVREYWVRIASVYMLLLSAVAGIGIALLLPTYFHIAFQINAVTADIDSAGSDEANAVLEDDIKKANALSRMLVESHTPVPATTVIAELVSVAGTAVTVEGVTIATTNQVVSSIVVTGKASTRSALLGMRDSIEQHEYFEGVVLPISNLAKDENIPFSITITPSKSLTQKP